MQLLGQKGEEVAVAFLNKKGWNVLRRNFSRKFGEIDIVARNNQGVLVFVEVKTMRISRSLGLKPEDHLTSSKLFKMRKMAEAFANNNPQLIQKDGWQIDLLAISALDCQSGEMEYKIEHYENL